MTDDKTDEQKFNEEKNKKISANELFQKSSNNPLRDGTTTAAFDIEYVPHKAQGLQSASDMWIDKNRIFEGLPNKKKDIKDFEKISRQ